MEAKSFDEVSLGELEQIGAWGLEVVIDGDLDFVFVLGVEK